MTGLIQAVKADGGTIYIKADGSIDPPTAPISTFDNITYTFTGNINDSIVIERDNIIVDGALYLVEGNGTPGTGITGIILEGRTNVTIKNMTIAAFDSDIAIVSSSSYITISGNNLTGNYGSLSFCLDLTASSNNTISGNNITNGIGLYNSAGNSISGNNIIASLGVGIDFAYYSSNNTVSGNNITNNIIGLRLDSSSNYNTIYDNNFMNNYSQVVSSGSTNFWNDGSRGNYWSDYLTKYPNATQVDSSGVWNTPYVIDTNNTDHYPLMVPYATIPEFPSIQATMFFMLLTLLTVIVYKKKGVKTNQS